MKLLISTHAPHYWVKLNNKGQPVEAGEQSDASLLSALPKGVTSVIGVIPGELVTMHSVEVPTNRYANMLSAIPYTLEEKLSEDIENLHFCVLNWKAGQPASVAVASKETIESSLQLFGDAIGQLDGIIPDYALLPIHSSNSTTVVRAQDDRYFVKQANLSTVVMDQLAFEYWWQDADQEASYAVNNRDLANEMKANGGERVSLWEIGENFTQWVNHAPIPDIQQYSLLRAQYEPEHLKPSNDLLNWAVGIAACALILLGGSNWFELQRLKNQHQANQDEIRALFSEAFPDQEYLGQPRRQIATLLSIDDSGGVSEQFQYLLQVVSEIAPQNQAEFLEINFRNEALQVGVTAPTFAALEQMTAQLDDSEGIRAALVSSGSEANSVKGQIKLIVSGS